MKAEHDQPHSLLPFVGNPREPMPAGLSFRLNDYRELVDWAGQIIRHDKCGAINVALLPILERLNIAPDEWLILTTRFEVNYKGLVGCVEKVKRVPNKLGYQRTQGLSAREAIFTQQNNSPRAAKSTP